MLLEMQPLLLAETDSETELPLAQVRSSINFFILFRTREPNPPFPTHYFMAIEPKLERSSFSEYISAEVVECQIVNIHGI